MSDLLELGLYINPKYFYQMFNYNQAKEHVMKALLPILFSLILLSIGCSPTRPEETYPAYFTDTLTIVYFDAAAVDSIFREDMVTKRPWGVGSHQCHYDTIIIRDTLLPKLRYEEITGTTWYLHEPAYRVLHRVTFVKDSLIWFKQYYTKSEQVSRTGIVVPKYNIYREKMKKARNEHPRYMRDKDNDVLYEWLVVWTEYWRDQWGNWNKPIYDGVMVTHFVSEIKLGRLHFGSKEEGTENYYYHEWSRDPTIVLTRK